MRYLYIHMYNYKLIYCFNGRSVLEEEDERGVAHIVEHLAFSATTRYTNHDIIKFLESIGAEFGACQNAVTSADDTVYELFVPVDKPELLSQAILVLAEFSTEVLMRVLPYIVIFRFLLLQYIYLFHAGASLKRRFGKRKRSCLGRVSRESECNWKDAGCTLGSDDGRFTGI